jgi:hypothetical protein
VANSRPLDRAQLYPNISLEVRSGISVEIKGPPRAFGACDDMATKPPKTDITTDQEWLGHANVSTTRLYDGAKRCPRQLDLLSEVLRV